MAEPNIPMEAKRMRVEIGQTALNIDKNELRVMDLEDEIRRVNEDTERQKAALPTLRAKLADLEKGQAK